MMDYTKIASNQEPAPVVTIQLLSSIGRTIDAKAILDTGSSLTLVPEYILDEIKAQETGADIIMDVTGKMTLVPLYDTKITVVDFPNLNLPPIPVAGISNGLTVGKSKCVIAGRDILNQFKLLLDGPQLQFNIQ